MQSETEKRVRERETDERQAGKTAREAEKKGKKRVNNALTGAAYDGEQHVGRKQGASC